MRWIELSGEELVTEVRAVKRLPAKDSITNSDYIIWFRADGEGVEIHDGKIFVMNENGKTIASYVVNSDWKIIK